jgi:hypothetical protein
MSRLSAWYRQRVGYWRYPLFMAKRFGWVRSINTSVEPLANRDVLDVVTVAFNNAALIEHQIRLLKDNLTDPHIYTVIDNSSRPEMRASIEALCARTGTAYVGLPANPFLGQPSLSHGAALNWTYRNYLLRRKARYWGSIDHDLFPVRRTSPVARLQACGLYGAPLRRGDTWYLWPGFCFFAAALTDGAAIDFMPGEGYDTGATLWRDLYSRLPQSARPTVSQRPIRLREGDNYQSDYAAEIDEWLHMINGSNWAGTPDKSDLFEVLLKQASNKAPQTMG